MLKPKQLSLSHEALELGIVDALNVGRRAIGAITKHAPIIQAKTKAMLATRIPQAKSFFNKASAMGRKAFNAAKAGTSGYTHAAMQGADATYQGVHTAVRSTARLGKYATTFNKGSGPGRTSLGQLYKHKNKIAAGVGVAAGVNALRRKPQDATAIE